MSLIDSSLKAVTVARSTVATMGSILVHHDADTGKDSVNLIPAVAWFYGLSVVGCSLSQGEPFSTCVRSILSVFGG